MRGCVVLFVTGAVIRLYLMNCANVARTIQERVEVSTPVNSWTRVKEGVFLQSQGIAVYSGGVYHETPITLLSAAIILRWSLLWQQLLFIVCDLLTAYVLGRVAAAYAAKLLSDQRKEAPTYSSDSSHLLLKEEDLKRTVVDVTAVYLLCPFTILSCVAMTTTTFQNLLISLSLLAMLTGHPVLFGSMLACATYQTLYPVILLVPGVLALRQTGCRQSAVLSTLLAYAITPCLLLYLSAEIAGGWDFLEATYGFILSAPDLTPNIGLFWYFFTEMFEHFRLFFLAVFQLNAVIYVAPLCVRLQDDPVLLSISLLALSAVFRSYPSLGDVGLYFALLPSCKHLYVFLRQSFIAGCMIVASAVLGPIMYNLWIFSGAANANFYFAVTLAFNTAQIFLVSDLLFGHVKRQHLLLKGSSMTIDGEPARLTLE